MSEPFRFHPIIKINELNRSVYKDSIFHIQRLNPNETRTKQRKYFRKVDLLSAELQYQYNLVTIRFVRYRTSGRTKP